MGRVVVDDDDDDCRRRVVMRDVRRGGRGRRERCVGALAAALALAAADAADAAATCYCSVAACTPSTMVDSTSIVPVPQPCTAFVSGSSVNGNIDLRYAKAGVTVTSFTLGPGITHWNGDITIDQTQSYTLDLTGLTHLNGTLNGYWQVPSSGGMTITAPNLLYATALNFGTNTAINFPALQTVGVEVAGVAGVTGSIAGLSVRSSATPTFPSLTTVKGRVSCQGATGSDDCQSATTFPALTTIIGGHTGGGVSLPALVNITGDLTINPWLQITPFAWAPLLTTVGGSLSLEVDANTDTSLWPPIANIGRQITVRSTMGSGSPSFTSLSLPGVSVGSISVNFHSSSPAAGTVTELTFPNLTTITGVGLANQAAKIEFWGMRDVTDIRFPALTSQNATLETTSNTRFWSHDGTSSTPPPADSTPVNVHVQCISAMSYWYTQAFFSDASIVCPTGCNLCSSTGGPGPAPPATPTPPPATSVTSASLSAAVTACFAEDTAGNCQCSGSGCGVLSGPISSWSFTGTNLNMDSLFEAKSTFNQNIGSWDVSGATSMKKMFKNATSFNQPIGSWNTGAVTDMGEMFAGATSFARDISGWDVDQVTASTDMFDGATAFNVKYTCVGAKCTGDAKSSDDLSRGEIAGIAVGCIAFAFAAVLLIACCRRRRASDDGLQKA